MTTTLVAMLYLSKHGIGGPTVNSLLGSILSGSFQDCQYALIADHNHVSGRNRASAMAIDGNFDYLLFLDSDMDWPPETLPRLKACAADVACLDMWGRGIPSFRIVLGKNGNGSLSAVPDEVAARGLVEEVEACGMGCTLIRVDLLRRMREKIGAPLWFQSASHSDDISFCYLAKELCQANIKCDFGLVSGHWGVMRNVGQDFTRDARNSVGRLTAPKVLELAGVTHTEER